MISPLASDGQESRSEAESRFKGLGKAEKAREAAAMGVVEVRS